MDPVNFLEPLVPHQLAPDLRGFRLLILDELFARIFSNAL